MKRNPVKKTAALLLAALLAISGLPQRAEAAGGSAKTGGSAETGSGAETGNRAKSGSSARSGSGVETGSGAKAGSGAETGSGAKAGGSTRGAALGSGVLREASEHAQTMIRMEKDPDAPEAKRDFGYTEADARAAAEALYCFETNAIKKEVDISYLMSCIWYERERVMLEEKKQHVLTLYEGPAEHYTRAYLEALSGLLFFSTPNVLFLTEPNGALLVCVETEERFTEEEAANHYRTVQKALAVIEEVKRRTEGKSEADRAKDISDYVADRLSYDKTFVRNSLEDALQSGVTACVGYNALTGLLFGHSGIPYVSVVADTKDDSMEHIFGMGKIDGVWRIFDTSNYDRETGREAEWIFSDFLQEGAYYKDFRLVEEEAQGPESDLSHLRLIPEEPKQSK